MNSILAPANLPVGINVGHYEERPSLVNKDDIAASPLVNIGARFFRVIRFMNWQKINQLWAAGEPAQLPKPQVTVADAPTADGNWQNYREGQPFRDFAGVPVEVCVEFANVSNASPWICIPTQADDALIRYIVETVIEKAKYKPIFEYSNEIWNSGFAQQQFAAEKGGGGATSGERFRSALRWQAQRTAQIRRSIGNEDAFLVVSAHANSDATADFLLNETSVTDHVDALTIAPYFGQSIRVEANEVPPTLHQLSTQLTSIVDGQLRQAIRSHVELAADHNLPLWAYEAGQHLVARNQVEVDLFKRMNQSKIIRNSMEKLLRVWFEEGGQLICPYSLTSRYEPRNEYESAPTSYFGHIELVPDGGVARAGKYTSLINSMSIVGHSAVRV